MQSKPTTVLLIEDQLKDVRRIEQLLFDAGAAGSDSTFDLIHADRLEAGLARLASQTADIILLDLTLPDSQGTGTIARLRLIAPNIPIITITDVEDESVAIEAVQRGTQDYLVKGSMNGRSLVRAIRHAIERQRLIAELATKARELETRNTELDEFAHTVAHQVQGLLSQMIGYTGYIEINYGNQMEEEVRRLLRQILQSGNKMNNVISELLLLASVRKGEVIQVPLNMKRIVAEAQKRLQFQIERNLPRSITQPDEWPVALGYPSWIEEVWVNYISNALKYGGDFPTISLGAEPSPNGMIRFWVQDSGPGISPPDQRRLFNPHTRLRQIRARGEGLGLSIVRRIVEKCGGQVGVESAPDAGSLFWFTLPQADDSETAQLQYA